MKSKQYDNLVKKYGAEEVASNFIFPGTLSLKEKKEADAGLRDALAHRRAAMSDEDKLKAKLMQLRFQIEDYIKDSAFDKSKTFGYFLRAYIGHLQRKQTEFATEINIKPAELSQYVNGHRHPTRNVMVRLELHSHNIIPATDWYLLLEKQNVYYLMHDKAVRREQRRYVKKEALAS